MVGSAWLFAPLYAAKIAGPPVVFSWIIAGIAIALIALTFAELSVLLPVAGGSAHIPQLSHGTFASFILSWIAWISALAIAPVEVQAILLYTSTYFPSLSTVTHGIHTLSHTGLLYATVLMLLFCIINSVSFRGLSRFNSILFAFNISIILFTLFSLLKTNFHPENFSGFSSAWSLDGLKSMFSAIAMGGIAFAFNGFKHGVDMAGETKKMAIAIPLATVGAVLFCVLLYTGLQIAFIGALPASALTQGWQSLHFTGDVGPFAGLAAGLGLIWIVKLLCFDAAISPAGSGLSYVTASARVLYAMSQLGYVPKFLSYLNKQDFPIAAIGVNFILGMCLFFPFPGWQSLVNFLVSGIVLSYAIGPIALLSLRFELPQVSRTFQLPAARLICLLAFYFCNLMSYWTGWETISKLAIALCIGIVFFIIACLKSQLKNLSLGLNSLWWMMPYLIGLISISYLGAFGGKNIIPFGWDFLVIGIFSAFILYLAVKNRAPVSEEEWSLREKEFAHTA